MTGSREAGLPADLLNKARGRVLFFALLMTVLSPLHLVAMLLTVDQFFYLEAVIDGTVFSTSLLLVLLTRSRHLSDSWILNLTSAYFVILCLSISIATPWIGYVNDGVIPYLSWTCVLIVLYPLVVPTDLRRNVVVSVIAALTVPSSVLLLDRLGVVQVTGHNIANLSISPAICVVMAIFGSRVVYGYSAAVIRARQMGSYQLEELLGSGGMGEVWRAKHGLLARPAAVKLIRPEVLGAGSAEHRNTLLERFKREAQVTAALTSPHTVRLFDFGTTDDGAFYYVMELIGGLDLETMVDRFGPMPADRVIHLLCQVCASLDEAHHCELIHRDIKPANIFACRAGRESDFVKVVDFGLVKPAGSEQSGGVKLTMDGTTTGTPAYMAPESATGTGPADARSDLYSLGCVAYWLLTGGLVFEAETSIQMVVEHVKTEPTLPSKRVELTIPEDLERIVMSCLQKDPEQRPQSARELARQLRACPAGSTWTPERAEQWWTTHLPDLESCAATGACPAEAATAGDG